MIKKINIEEIKKREEFLSGKLLTRKEVECALEEAKASVKRNMEYLNGKFPFSAAIILSHFHQNGTECTRLQKM